MKITFDWQSMQCGAIPVAEDSRKFSYIHGFDQMQIEPCLFRLFPVFFFAPPGNRDDSEWWIFLDQAQATRDFVAINARHADIEQDDVGLEIYGPEERRRSLIGDACIVSERFKQQIQGIGGIDVVVDNQNSPGDRIWSGCPR